MPQSANGAPHTLNAAYLRDASSTLDEQGARAALAAGEFRHGPPEGILNFGYSSAAYWVHLPLGELPADSMDWILELYYFSLNEVDIYIPGREPVYAGLMRAPPASALAHRYLALPLQRPATQTAGSDGGSGLLLRITSTGSLTVPLRFWRPAEFQQHTQTDTFVLALYYGALLALALYNLLVYASLRDRNFLLYSGFALSVGAGMFALNGFSQLFLRGWLWLHETSGLFALASVFAVLFARSVLNARKNTPRLDRTLKLVTLLLIAVLLLTLLMPMQRSLSPLFSLLVACVAIMVLLTTIIAYRKRQAGAGYLLVAWTLLLCSVVVTALRNLGALPTTSLSLNLLQFGSALEMLLLFFALAARIHAERTARSTAQAETVELKEQLVAALEQSRQALSAKVEQRTEALSDALRREQATLGQYQQFASLIAHEFRNPLGVIRAQAQLGLRERELGVGEPTVRFNAVERAAERLQKLFERWLQSEQIVNGEFTIARQPLVLDEWLSEVLKREAREGTVYFCAPENSKLPPECRVMADPALLRMALDNLLDNASKYAGPEPTITVRIVASTAGSDIDTGAAGHSSSVTATAVGIAVSDNGPGIPPEEQAQVFDSYQRGREQSNRPGLGLGLFLVKRIMQLHGGNVTLSSTDEGSTFTLWLPITEVADGEPI